MNYKRVLQGIWLVAAAYFIGRCRIFGMHTLAAGFFTAVCLADGSTALCYISIMLAIGFSSPVSMPGLAATCARYGIILLGIACITGLRNRLAVRHSEMTLPFLSGLLTFTIDLGAVLVMEEALSLTEAFAEGLLVFSSAVVYGYAVRVIKIDYARIASENEAAISVTALAASVMYGMPVHAWGGIIIAEAFGLFGILFAMYKFGFGLGMAWTVICSMIVSASTGETDFLTIWIVVTIAAFAMYCLMQGGRIAFALIYMAVYVGLGLAVYDTLLDEESLKAVISAVFVFLLLPSRMMIQVDTRVSGVEPVQVSSAWGKLVIDRINGLASAFKRIEYTLAGSGNTGIGLNDVGELIEDFTNQLEQEVPLKKTAEANIIEELTLKGVQVRSLALIKNRDERYEVYITSRVKRGRIMSAEAVKKIIEKETGLQLVLKDESRSIVGKNYDIICMKEKPAFRCLTAVRRMSRYAEEVCGDNFYIGDIREGYKLIMIADGMGNGSRASASSSSLIEALEELIAAGFNQEASIRLVNSYLSDKNRGEQFTTLDMLLLDLHTGYGKLYKQGAATTYIRRGEWMEMIKSTSLPVGVIDGAVCEHCAKKFYDKDMIVMVSDGILESIIFENKEDYMRELLHGIDSDDPQDVVDYIAQQIKAQSGNRLQDDATVIACKLVKSL